MSQADVDLEVLVASGVWSATPWDYSSCRFFRLRKDGTGDLTYGYGQTIYAIMECRFDLLSGSILRLTYVESPRTFRSHLKYIPSDTDRTKEIGFKLVAGAFNGIESIVGWPFTYRWKLEFEQSPFPQGLFFPHDVPLIYYGHRDENLSGPKAKAHPQ